MHALSTVFIYYLHIPRTPMHVQDKQDLDIMGNERGKRNAYNIYSPHEDSYYIDWKDGCYPNN